MFHLCLTIEIIDSVIRDELAICNLTDIDRALRTLIALRIQAVVSCFRCTEVLGFKNIAATFKDSCCEYLLLGITYRGDLPVRIMSNELNGVIFSFIQLK